MESIIRYCNIDENICADLLKFITSHSPLSDPKSDPTFFRLLKKCLENVSRTASKAIDAKPGSASAFKFQSNDIIAAINDLLKAVKNPKQFLWIPVGGQAIR